MKKIILIFIGIFSICRTSFGQILNDKIMFVIDSIPVIDDPEYGNEILQTDVSDITVIKKQRHFKSLGLWTV